MFPKTGWVLNQDAFRHFLNWLDEGVDSGGERYLEMRRRLVFYFDRKNCASPDDLADETLNRVARRLEEEGTIRSQTPAQYCYVVARFIFLESLRKSRNPKPIDERFPSPDPPDEESEESERRAHCLGNCIQKLDSDQRNLILNYYQGERRAKINNRSTMAKNLGITMNALSIRACRLRERLETCMGKCLQHERF